MKYKYERGKIFGKKLKVPKDVLSRVYAKSATFDDFVMFDLFDKIPLDCMHTRDKKIYQKIGLEKSKSLDWDVIRKLSFSYYIDRDTFRMPDELLKLIDGGKEPVEALDELSFKMLKPSDYSPRMIEVHPERIFSEEEKERFFREGKNEELDVVRNYNEGKLSISDIISNWNILKDKDLSYCLLNDLKNEQNITNEQFKDIMNQFGSIIVVATDTGLIDPYTFLSVVTTGSKEAKEEYLYRVCTDTLKHVLSDSTNIQLDNSEYRELFKHVDATKFIKENKPSCAYEFEEILKKTPLDEILNSEMPFHTLIKSDVLRVVYYYGLNNILQFDHECNQFFSKDNFRMLKLISPMYLHYNNNSNNNTSFIPVKYDQDGNPSQDYTIDDFYDIVKRMVIYGPTDGGFSNFVPYFRSIGGKFREVYPTLFLSDDVPEELKDLFYNKQLTPTILLEHPEYIPYLVNKDLTCGFKSLQINVSYESEETVYEYTEDYKRVAVGKEIRTQKKFADLYGLLLKNYSYEDTLTFVKNYAYFFPHLNDDYYGYNIVEDSSIDEIKKALIDVLKKNIIYNKKKYPEFIPDDAIDSFPEMFLPKDAPEEIKTALYNRTLTSEMLKAYKDDIDKYFSKIDLKLVFKNVSVLREKNREYYPSRIGLIEFLESSFNRKEIFELMFGYGKYLDQMTEISTVFKADLSKEEIINQLEEEIYKDLVYGKYIYDEEMPESFKKKYPTLFLDKSVPKEIRDKYYNRELTIEDYGNPEVLKYFKNTDIAFGFPLEYSWIHKLFNSEPLETANLYKIKVLAYTQKIEDVGLRKVFMEYLIKTENINMDTIKYSVEVLRRLSLSNSSEIRNFRLSLANQILNTKDPLQSLEQIEEMFIKNHMPVVGKIYSCFRILHPDTSGFNYDFSMISPVLRKSRSNARELIIFSDLIKASFGSNNRSVNDYLDNISICNEIYKKIRIGKIKYEDLSKEDQERMFRFSRNISTLYNNSLLSKRQKNSFVHTDSVIDDINKLYELVSPNGKLDYDLGDRVVSMFCHFAGIDTVAQAKKYIKDKIHQAEQRNVALAKDGLVLHKGDFIKGIGDIKYLGTILQNGSVAKEFLGSSASSDSTPLDTDLSLIMSDGKIRDQIGGTAAGGYGPIYFVLKGDDRFYTTRTSQETVQNPARNLSKLEVFYTGVLGLTHYGIRTGFASSEIDCIVIENYDRRIGLEIAKNGFYIPVADMDGKITFTYEDYLAFRKTMAGMSHFGENKYKFSDHLVEPDVEELALLIEESNVETARKRAAINEAIAESLEEIGLKLKTTIDGDLTEGSVELIDTGSTGRGTNKPGDGDFDFMMRVDKSVISDSKKMDELKQVLLKHLGREHDSSGIIGSGDFRLKGVDVSDTVHVDIDITFIEKTDKVTYSTDMALEDRLSTIREQDPEKYPYVVANILLAKQVLKAAEAYKPKRGETPQGGLGGVGIENWVLQHGGSFYDAAVSFLEAAEGKSFDEFKSIYAVWDFGENHLAAKNGRYPHDNFVANNMSAEGYGKMVKALKEYANSKTNENNKTNSK